MEGIVHSLRLSFASNLKRIRTTQELSQENLAFMCGLHRTYISDVERGNRNISIDNIEKIALALDVSPASLLTYTTTVK